MPENNKYYKLLNNLILTFLVLQVISVSVSIAVSSIAFGTWGGLWIIQLIAFHKEPASERFWQENKIIIFFFIFYAAAELASRVFAVFPDGALIGLKRLLLFFILLVAVFKIPDRKTIYFVLFLLVCSVSGVSLYELIKYAAMAPEQISQKGFTETRIDYLHYPLTSAEIKIMVLMAILPFFLVNEKFFLRKRYLAVISIPIVISMYLTQSRNVFLALIVCLIIFGLIKNRKILLISIAAAVILLFILPAGMTSRFTSIFDVNHQSNAARLTLWSTGWKMFLANPVIGVGDNHIMEVYSMYKYPLSDWEHSHLHSNIFMILATTGIAGFTAFAGFFISIFIKQVKFYKEIINEADRALILGSILVFIAFQVSGVFEWSFGDHEVMTVFFFLISIPFIIFKLSVTKKLVL